MAVPIRSLVATAFATIALIGCAPAVTPQTAPTSEPNQSFSHDMSAADRAACSASGGRVERRGRMAAELCVTPFADAGKQCTDSAQCAGKCLGTADHTAAAGPVSGQCQADNRLFGCHSEIKGGRAVNAICVD